jgi:hypothetical protein
MHQQGASATQRNALFVLLLKCNLRMHASLSCVVLNKYHEDGVQVFGAFTGFLCGPIKQ